MIKPPFGFDGSKFAAKYNLDPFKDFYIDGSSFLVCPSYPDLIASDLLDCLVDTPSPYEVFYKPIQTPALYAEDIFVSSRDIKDDPDEAFAEALQETRKEKGQPKSLDLITRSALKALERSREDIKDLKKTISDLEKRLKKLEK